MSVDLVREELVTSTLRFTCPWPQGTAALQKAGCSVDPILPDNTRWAAVSRGRLFGLRA
jgi:hypothetical protein